ncbi:histone H2B type 1-A-like [Arvicanthis niloticus]|uniref:histone H2B type 1-A-like n=1 Tax=Arvicanthis niloticus TaxID=61156 RepID=UPI0014860497|nr:histone H2B type 1-A-like [Arvicanthis niloticus]
MASTLAEAVLEELSSNISEEPVKVRKPKKGKSKREKDWPQKEKPKKKPKKEKPEQEKLEKKQVKKKPEKKQKKKWEKEKPEQKKQEKERRRSLRLLQLQSIKEDERRIARLMRRQRKNSFAIYFLKVLKNIHVGFSLSQRSVSILDSFVKDMFERIASEASFLARQIGSSTINSREIQTAVCLLLPGDLCKQAVSEGTMAMVRYILNE